MPMRETFHTKMPAMLKHAGRWEGVYTHVNREAIVIDRHRAVVVCEFPIGGPYVYIQHNEFTWDDGRTHKISLPGTFKNDRLWWDTDTFYGSAWQSKDDIILLNLTRKDDPGAMFFEIITLGETGNNRSRTWQWFKDGKLFKRTLCDEWRIAD